jgi:lipid-A-disaccharide synthase
VVIYHVSRLTYAIAKRMVKVDHVAMANLIAGRAIVPELIQHDFQAPIIVQHLQPLLAEGEPRATMLKDLAEVGHTLRRDENGCNAMGPDAVERVSEIVVEELGLANQAVK